MKNIKVTFLLIFILAPIGSFCQNISYGYDLAGNRIQRTVVMLKSAKTDSTSVWENKQSQDIISGAISVFPNPTDDLLQINIGVQEINQKIKIILSDINGKLIYNQETDNPIEKVNMSGYSSGVYILRIEVNSEIKEWKIIKE